MLVKTFGSAVYGVEAITITIEVNWLNQSGKDMTPSSGAWWPRWRRERLTNRPMAGLDNPAICQKQ